MRWQQIARVVVAAAGLGTAAAIYMLARPKPLPPSPSGTVAMAQDAQLEAVEGTEIRYDGDRQIGSWTYKTLRQYAGNRAQLEHFRYEFAGGGFMSADFVEKQGAGTDAAHPGDITAKGNVVFQNRDGMTVRGGSAQFNDAGGIAIMDGPVSFTRGATSGSGTGAVYEQKTGRFMFQQDTHVIMTPDDPAGSPIDATSMSMVFASETKTMIFSGNTRITRSTDVLSSENTTLFLSDDEKTFKAIELRTNARVSPVPGNASALPEMQAEDIDLLFYPGGSALQNATLKQRALMVLASDSGRRSVEGSTITFRTAADGKTLTQLRARDRAIVTTPRTATSPERKISGNTLDAAAATGQEQKGLSAARFDGSVEFLELVPGTGGQQDSQRRGTAQTLNARISGQFESIDEARFEQNVVFTDGSVTGNAGVGIYRAAKGELELRPLGGKLSPQASNGSVNVDAKDVIFVNLSTNDIVAMRDVNTVSTGAANGKTPKADSAAIFNGTDKLYGSGAEFEYTAKTGRVRYRGAPGSPARLRQTQGKDNTSVVVGDEIIFSEDTQNLTATGHVDTTFTMAPASGSAAGQPYRASADSLDYVDALRRATYKGAPAALKQPDAETRAATLVLVLAKDSRTLQRLIATSKVRMTFVEGRLAEAESLDYDAAKGSYIVRGHPVTLWTRDSDGTCSIHQSNYSTFDNAIGAPASPPDENPDGTRSTNLQPCSPDVPPLPPSRTPKK